MEHRIVEKLEAELEGAIDEVITRMGLKTLPVLPNRQTIHLMSKAAVTVYEAAVENHDPQD